MSRNEAAGGRAWCALSRISEWKRPNYRDKHALKYRKPSSAADAFLGGGGKGGAAALRDVPALVRRPPASSGQAAGPSGRAPSQGDGNVADVRSFLAGQRARALEGAWYAGAGPVGRPAVPATLQNLGPQQQHQQQHRLESSLRAFVQGADLSSATASLTQVQARTGVGAPTLMTVADQVRVRDRATVLARHIGAAGGPRGAAEADARVESLLRGLGIDVRALPARLPPPGLEAMEGAWKAGRGAAAGATAAPPWAEAASSSRPAGPGVGGDGWAAEFRSRERPTDGPGSVGAAWARELIAGRAADPRTTPPALATSARGLAGALARTGDPRQGDSGFASFLAALSEGAAPDEAGALATAATSSDAFGWANEFSTYRAHHSAAATGGAWAHEMAAAAPAVLVPGASDPARAAAGLVPDALEVNGWVAEFQARMGGAGGAAGASSVTWDGQWDVADADAAGASSLFGDDPTGSATAEAWAAAFAEGRDAGSAAADGTEPGPYPFATVNPWMGRDPAACLQAARAARVGGAPVAALRDGLLAAEAAAAALHAAHVAPGAGPDTAVASAEAWTILGTLNAEADDDGRAIAAMAAARRTSVAAGRPAPPSALLALAVGYANELRPASAAACLADWLRGHLASDDPAVAHLPAPGQTSMPGATDAIAAAFEEVAARSGATPDLLEAVGVLRSSRRDSAGAASAFRAALSSLPSSADPASAAPLLNRLGAVTAHAGDPVAAARAHAAALRLRPNLVRARVNMGVAAGAAGRWGEAASAYLDALMALSVGPGGRMAMEDDGPDHLAGYLRNALVCAGRSHLLPAVAAGDWASVRSALADGGADPGFAPPGALADDGFAAGSGWADEFTEGRGG